MRLEHQIKNVLNKVQEAQSDHTPGQSVGHDEHPISKSTADYEEKFFTIPGGEGKDDREKMGVTGKPKEHKKDVESTEGHENPTKKTHGKNGQSRPEAQEEVEDIDEGIRGSKPSDMAMTGYIPKSIVGALKTAQMKFDWWLPIGQNGAKESDKQVIKFEPPQKAIITGTPTQGKFRGKVFAWTIKPDGFTVPPQELKKHRLKDDMNLELKQVKNLTERKAKEQESFMGAMAHAKSQGKDTVKIGGKEHPVKMDNKTAKSIKKSKKDNGTHGKDMSENLTWEQAVRKAQDTAVQTTKQYWEEEIRKNQEGWGGKGGVPGKGTVTTVRKKNEK